MDKVIEFIEGLIGEMEDCLSWSFEGIVEVKEIEENGRIYGIANDEVKRYEKQGNEFIRQWTGYCEDDFNGFILKPLEDNKYLKISYAC